MTNTEFITEFDVLYNNIASNMLPGVTNYEKSIFLTQAQEQIIVELYKGSLIGEPYDTTEEVNRLLNKSIISIELPYEVIPNAPSVPVRSIFSEFSYVYKLPADSLYIVYEQVINTKGEILNVLPISTDEYYNIKDNPFRGVESNVIFRINYGEITGDIMQATRQGLDKISLIYGNKNKVLDIQSYKLRILTAPTPIILESGYPPINGIGIETQCLLPYILHRPILKRAVEIAKSVWTGVN